MRLRQSLPVAPARSGDYSDLTIDLENADVR